MRALRTCIVLLLAGLSSLSATSLYISSAGGMGTNDYLTPNTPTALNVAIPQDGSWSTLAAPLGQSTAPVWISYGNTICDGCTHQNPTPPLPGEIFYDPGFDGRPNPFVIFQQTVIIPAGMFASVSDLEVLADDSVTVDINGGALHQSFIEPASIPFNYDLHNGTHGVGGGITNFGGALHPGTNTIIFQVTNLGSGDVGTVGNGTGGVSSFGLQYFVLLSLDPVPEPGTVALVGLGLLFGFSRLRKKS
jgi:PEP-CTERM motif